MSDQLPVPNPDNSQLPPQSPPPISEALTSPSSSFFKKKIKIAAIGLGIILLIVVGWQLATNLLFKKIDSDQNQLSKNEPAQLSDDQSTTQPESTDPLPSTETVPAEILADENWLTYTNDQAGYSFKYPAAWPLVKITPHPGCETCIDQVDFSPNSGQNTIAVVLVSREAKIQSLADYVNYFISPDSSKINVNYLTINGEAAVSYQLAGGLPPLPLSEIVMVKNGYSYLFRLEGSEITNQNLTENLAYFNQLVNSVQLTNPEAKQNDLSWQPARIDLYDLSLDFPDSTWTITENNRRPEPTDDGSARQGHDCANYVISNSAHTAQINLDPSCGFSEGFGTALATNAVRVKDLDKDNFMVRFFDEAQGAYFYTEAGQVEISDLNGTRQEIYQDDPATIALAKNDDLIFLKVKFKYSGLEKDKEAMLGIVDRLVSSLR